MIPFSYPTSADEWQNFGLGLTIIAFTIAFGFAIGSAVLNWKTNKTKREESRQKDEKIALEFKAKDELIANLEKRAAEATAEAATAKAEAANANKEAMRIETEGNQRIAEVEAKSQERIAEVQAEARKEVARLTAETSQAQAQAAIANEIAQRERLERERMTEFSLPRKLNLSKFNEYLGTLRLYAGTKFFVVTLTDTEPTRTGRMIEELLVSAGWEKQPMVRYAEADESQIPDGIWVEANGPIVGSPSSPMKPAMEALNAVLINSNISSNMSFLNPRLPPDKLPPGTLRIVIGMRPNFYFDIKKNEQENRRRPPGQPHS